MFGDLNLGMLHYFALLHATRRICVKRFATIKAMYFFTPRRCESTQKIMYKNKGQALMAAEQSLRERGAQLWVYACEYCGCWHLTHKNPVDRMYSDMRSPSASAKPKSRKRGYKPRRR